jgi:hypothetical protein
MAASCGFPSGFGRNWEALADCLSDLSWAEPARGFLLLYEGWGMLARSEPESWSAAQRIMEGACAHWSGTSTPFAVLLRGPGPDMNIPQLT